MSAFFAIVIVVIYFYPTITAVRDKHPQKVNIFLVNLFFGITIIGYFVAFVWASRANQARARH